MTYSDQKRALDRSVRNAPNQWFGPGTASSRTALVVILIMAPIVLFGIFQFERSSDNNPIDPQRVESLTGYVDSRASQEQAGTFATKPMSTTEPEFDELGSSADEFLTYNAAVVTALDASTQPEAAQLPDDKQNQENPPEPTLERVPHEPARPSTKMRAGELLDEALILERCASVPRDRITQLTLIDHSRTDQSRSEVELVSTFKACSQAPVATRSEITDAFLAAAEAGSVKAQFGLAGRYPLGSDENLQWNHIAAFSGHTQAQATLARFHLAQNTAEDNRIAYSLLQRLRLNGSAISGVYLERLEQELSVSAWRELSETEIDYNQ